MTWKLAFDDPFFEGWTKRILSGNTSGCIEVGEVVATAAKIVEGDRASWFREWCALGERHFARAEEALAKGHRVTARGAFFRAGTAFNASWPIHFGNPIPAEVRKGFSRETEAFHRMVALLAPPAEPRRIPFEGGHLPALFFRGGEGARPLLVMVNGYDGTMLFEYACHGAAALARGWHVLLFDGPGQGGALIEQGLAMRPDFETVLSAVLDETLANVSGIDESRVAVSGWSFGGYLAARGTAGDPRVKALVLDPPVGDGREAMRGFLRRFGISEDVIDRLDELTEEDVRPIVEKIRASDDLNWRILQRGTMVHQVDGLAGYVRAFAAFEVMDRLPAIACPTLVASADQDPLSIDADSVFERLACPKTRVRFTATDGAGEHCEAYNRSLFNEVVFDWLEETFGRP